MVCAESPRSCVERGVADAVADADPREHTARALDDATAGFAAREHAAQAAARNEVRTDPLCLLVGSPREVLARIVAGDPLDVRDAVASVLRAECVFLDADRVHLRALARVARAASRFTAARTDLAVWIRSEVDGAVNEILREESERRPPDPGTAFAQFARPLGLDPEAIRRGCIAFNRLPYPDRFAFCALVLRHVGLDALARETGVAPSELGRRARRGLDAVLHANHPELAPPTDSSARAQAEREAGGSDAARSNPEQAEPVARPSSPRAASAHASRPAARASRAAATHPDRKESNR